MESRWTTTSKYAYKMHYRAMTDGAYRLPIVLIHGLIVASTYMEPLALSLSPWFPVFVPDLPGFGKSTASRILSIRELTDALVDWLDAARISRAHFIGNSMGCQIIVDLAARYPMYVERCILQGPIMDSTRRSVPLQLLYLMVNGLREPPSMGRIMLVDYWRAGVARAYKTMSAALHDRMDIKLPLVEAPTLVVFSEHDIVAPLPWCSFVAQAVQKGSLVCLEGAAHTANYSATPQLARVVRQYLLPGVSFRALAAANMLVYPSRLYRSLPVADFDSATAMLRATAATLRGEDFPQLGVSKNRLLTKMVTTLNRLPEGLRTQLYTWTGSLEAISTEELDKLTTEEIFSPLLEPYPRDQTYPVIAIGSSNGALVHLYAALGIPWLPQTALVPIKRAADVAKQADGTTVDMSAEMRWGEAVAQRLLERNPALQLHHMADPNQDLLMIKYMAYFRLKLVHLIESYKRFIIRHLKEKGVILVVNCKQRWPAVRLSARHYFQPGAVGGLQPDDYLEANAAVEAYIHKHHRGTTNSRNWHPPSTNALAPEAEWGFEEALMPDIRAFAEQHGYRLNVLEFEHPQLASSLVADLHQEWYQRERNLTPRGLIVDSFILMDPWWSLRFGFVPYWSVFSVESSLSAFKHYLRDCTMKGRRFERILLSLFNHGVHSIGIATAEQWASVAREHLAGSNPHFVGTSASRFPLDFSSVIRFNEDLRRLSTTMDHFCMPDTMRWDFFQEFMLRHEDMKRVKLHRVST